jgi:hypothetical protein
MDRDSMLKKGGEQALRLRFPECNVALKQQQPRGSCNIYEERPEVCREFHCDVQIKDLKRKCRGGCVGCCLDINVVQGEDGRYVVDRESRGPCQHIGWSLKPAWVKAEEAVRDEQDRAQPAGPSPLDMLMEAESRKVMDGRVEVLQRALPKLGEDDRALLNALFGLDGKKPRSIEEASAELGKPVDELQKRQAAVLGRLRKELGGK